MQRGNSIRDNKSWSSNHCATKSYSQSRAVVIISDFSTCNSDYPWINSNLPLWKIEDKCSNASWNSSELLWTSVLSRPVRFTTGPEFLLQYCVCHKGWLSLKLVRLNGLQWGRRSIRVYKEFGIVLNAQCLPRWFLMSQIQPVQRKR